MKVVTLDNEAFVNCCRRLEDATTPFGPDIVVGIAHGGVEVAQRIYPSLPHLTVFARRPSTRTKERHSRTMNLVRRLPRRLKDFLRIVESRLLSLRHPRIPDVRINPADFAGYRRILVVDDAVDSGATASGVLAAIDKLPGPHETALAVITVTTPHPIVHVDFALFTNRTLVRFPWSKDN